MELVRHMWAVWLLSKPSPSLGCGRVSLLFREWRAVPGFGKQPMKTEGDRSRNKKLDDYIKGVEAWQRNIVWPDTLQNAKSVDRLLFLGSGDLTFVQRIGMLLVACASWESDWSL